MIGLPIGSWDDKVDPDWVIKDVVGDCQTFLEDDALQPSPLSKKRKRIVEDLQNNVLEPSRSSKRPRDITAGMRDATLESLLQGTEWPPQRTKISRATQISWTLMAGQSPTCSIPEGFGK
jgi:hypothetical protein